MSAANVFIIESLAFDDEQEDRFDGRIIRDMLKFHEKECAYYYIRTKKELVATLKKFGESDFRYLHISCHGNSSQVGLTLDTLEYDDFSKIVSPHLKDKRLFISACEVMNDHFAHSILKRAECFSLMGTMTDVPFMDSAIFWQAFYHLMFKMDDKKMKRDTILKTANQLAGLFEVKIGYSYPNDGGMISKRHVYKLDVLEGGNR